MHYFSTVFSGVGDLYHGQSIMIVADFTCSDRVSWAKSTEYEGCADGSELAEDSPIAILFSSSQTLSYGPNICLVGLHWVVVVMIGIDGWLVIKA